MDDGEDNRGLKLIVAACALLAITVIGFGLMFKSADSAVNSKATNVLSQQQQMMAQAMEMAREAQAMNRQRMEMMQKAMHEEYEGAAIRPASEVQAPTD